MDTSQLDLENEKLRAPFKITTVAREDIVVQGLMTRGEALKLTDEDMERIGGGMAEGMMGNFWEALEAMVDIIKNK